MKYLDKMSSWAFLLITLTAAGLIFNTKWDFVNVDKMDENKVLTSYEDTNIPIGDFTDPDSYTLGPYLKSDIRLKDSILNLTESLEKIRKLQGVSFIWKSEDRGKGRQIGLIAQDLERIYPELVFTRDDGYKMVNYAQLTSVLIEGVKELESKLRYFEMENRNLKSSIMRAREQDNRINILETQVRQLMQKQKNSYPPSRQRN